MISIFLGDHKIHIQMYILLRIPDIQIAIAIPILRPLPFVYSLGVIVGLYILTYLLSILHSKPYLYHINQLIYNHRL